MSLCLYKWFILSVLHIAVLFWSVLSTTKINAKSTSRWPPLITWEWGNFSFEMQHTPTHSHLSIWNLQLEWLVMWQNGLNGLRVLSTLQWSPNTFSYQLLLSHQVFLGLRHFHFCTIWPVASCPSQYGASGMQLLIPMYSVAVQRANAWKGILRPWLFIVLLIHCIVFLVLCHCSVFFVLVHCFFFVLFLFSFMSCPFCLICSCSCLYVSPSCLFVLFVVIFVCNN